MTWNEVAEVIAEMPKVHREGPALTFDDNEGEYCEFEQLLIDDDEESSVFEMPYLDQKNEVYGGIRTERLNND